MAYSVIAEGRDENELEKLDIAIGMIPDPAEEALAELRRHQEVMGMEFEDPQAPVPGMPGQDGLEPWQR